MSKELNDSQSQFEKEFERLVCHELPKARKDAERAAALIERLASALSLAIAVAAGGDAKQAEKLLQGAEAFLAEGVTGLGRAAAIPLNRGNK